MATALDLREFQSRLGRLYELIEGVEVLDPAARQQLQDIVQALLHLYGSGWERALNTLRAAGDFGHATIESFANDHVIGGLLLLHGLHPHNLESRVRQALCDVEPAIRGHGGNCELLSVSDGTVRMRVDAGRSCCSTSEQSLVQAIEDAILARAPEVGRVEIQSFSEEQLPIVGGKAMVSLPMLTIKR